MICLFYSLCLCLGWRADCRIFPVLHVFLFILEMEKETESRQNCFFDLHSLHNYYIIINFINILLNLWYKESPNWSTISKSLFLLDFSGVDHLLPETRESWVVYWSNTKVTPTEHQINMTQLASSNAKHKNSQGLSHHLLVLQTSK